MTETIARRLAARSFRPSFHLWMTLLMAFFVFGGFGMSYIGPLVLGSFPHAPPIVHLHGAILFGWTLLLVVQALLVNVRNVRLHRSLGAFGIALGSAVVFVASLITVLGVSAGVHGFDDLVLFYLSIVAPPSFAVLFAMAVRAVRTPLVHRNLILFAMLCILMPGINRFYMIGLGLAHVPYLATYLTMDAMLAAILLHERRVTGGISRLTWIGAAIILVPQPLLPLVAPSHGFAALIQFLGSLAYYR